MIGSRWKLILELARVKRWIVSSEDGLTFQELFARVLLEERFMSNRPREIIDHEFEQRLDFLLIVSGKVSKCCVLVLLVIFSF